MPFKNKPQEFKPVSDIKPPTRIAYDYKRCAFIRDFAVVLALHFYKSHIKY